MEYRVYEIQRQTHPWTPPDGIEPVKWELYENDHITIEALTVSCMQKYAKRVIKSGLNDEKMIGIIALALDMYDRCMWASFRDDVSGYTISDVKECVRTLMQYSAKSKTQFRVHMSDKWQETSSNDYGVWGRNAIIYQTYRLGKFMEVIKVCTQSEMADMLLLGYKFCQELQEEYIGHRHVSGMNTSEYEHCYLVEEARQAISKFKDFVLSNTPQPK